ncbi:MAG: winged helix-turn-helix domain-containing protein [Candidatus Micrarchaeota archaeon]|nr:winged helix-turn-helix domain-containing protein [Candidatus Micrarchaeota archaeon]
MRLLLALFLLASFSFAEYVAYFEEVAGLQNESYPGHYGNYTVTVASYPVAYLSLFGPGASLENLRNEIRWLEQERGIAIGCDVYKLGGSGYLCSKSGEWIICEGGNCLASKARAFWQEGAIEAAVQPKEEPKEAPIAIAAILALLAIIAFLTIQKIQHYQEKKLLESPIKAQILSQLFAAERIPTYLSAKLGKSKSTILEHLESLVGAGLVEKVERPGKKFVFYRLTQKGRQAVLRKAS